VVGEVRSAGRFAQSTCKGRLRGQLCRHAAAQLPSCYTHATTLLVQHACTPCSVLHVRTWA
jgi:hypothetical protein